MTTPPTWPGSDQNRGLWPPTAPAPRAYPAPAAPHTGWNHPGNGYGPGAPPFPAPTPPRRTRTPLIITACAAAAVLLVIGVVAVLLNTGGEGRGSGAAATDIAQSYLEALARGDAAAALALSATQAPNSDLLTDDVLRRQLDALPISDIAILGETTEPGAATTDRTSVKVAMQLGDKRTEASIRMVRSGGDWKLDSAFVKVSTTAGVPTSSATILVAFGIPVGQSSEFYAFPGYLELTTSSPFIDVNSVAPLSFDDLGAMEVLDATYSMNDAGRKALQDLVLKRYEPCYGAGPKPAHCTFNTFDSTFDTATSTLTSPLDVAALTYTFEGTLTSAMINGTLNDVQLTMRRNDGQTVPLTADLHIFLMVDIATDPPKILTK